MNDAQYQTQQGGGFDARLDGGRETRENFFQQYPQAQPSYQPPPPLSPPSSASPFAFAPPPLSSLSTSGTSRPPLMTHHSEPSPVTQQYPYVGMKAQGQQPHGYQYITSAPMGYRSYSNNSERNSPQSSQSSDIRAPNGQAGPQANSAPSQPSPIGGSLQYQQRQTVGEAYGLASSHQPHAGSSRPGVYQQGYYTPSYPPPTSIDMPRSLSYPSGYTQPYPSYLPSISSSPSYHQIGGMGQAGSSLIRHNTLGSTSSSLVYGYGNRGPVQDRPFKCDECAQSFNRNHDLKRHKRIHLSVKPFGCEKCGKTFSRKDALRRHWLVKGCKGSDGATAPIVALYPLTESVVTSQPPALSPPTPSALSPDDSEAARNSGVKPSFSRSSAPPPLSTLPTRQSIESQIIVTPGDMAPGAVGGQPPTESATIRGYKETVRLMEPPLGSAGTGSRTGSSGYMSEEFGGGEYFENAGVLDLKTSSAAALEQSSMSPYSRLGASPPIPHNLHPHPHPYRRPILMSEGSLSSPTTASFGGRSFGPSSYGSEDKPVFAMPFNPTSQVFQQDGALSQSMEAMKMEKTLSSSSDNGPGTWQRWHRPSFPFPAPPGFPYIYDSTGSPIENSNSSSSSLQPPPQ